MRDEPSSPPEAAPALPFDPATLLRGVRGRWKVVAGFAVAGVVLGVFAALTFGVRTYEAEAVLLYQPTVGCPLASCSTTPPSLTSVADMVKVQPVLAKVRQDLGRALTLQELGASVTVTAKKGTDLVILRARGESPAEAQALCLAVRDAFLADQATRLRGDKTVELRRQAEQARTDRSTVRAQLAELTQRAAGLRSQAGSERKQLGLEDADRARVQRQIMLENINEDQRRRIATVELAQAEAEYRRAQQLAEREAISGTELDKVRAAFERAKQLAMDPPHVQELRAERQRLEELAASGGYGLTPAEQLLLLVLNRSVEVELRQVEVSERERALTAELKRLAEAPLADLGPAESGFAIIAQPQLPSVPVSSTRRVVAVAVALLLALLGGCFGVGKELLDRSLRSGADAALCLNAPPLAVLPLSVGEAARPGETFRLLAGRLRQAIQANQWSRILVASAVHGEGRSTTSAELARSLTELGERVRVVSLRPGQAASEVLGRDEAGARAPGELLIVDGPPVLPYADTLLLAPAVDCAVVIVKAGSTHRDSVRRALARLQEAGIPQLGVVLNAVTPRFLRPADVVEGAR